ncbi:unnamed protein product [Vitrella brassicaformis CCMP3155]|uniref:Poly A polymerase head domain-containing protein n=2 Tax=Vitrella brassicaformis TaxID=1169539 RepID=A0A0G4E894_VITBC|nr:unnamed protein product [Vitrella brassicaformis CCMP3155]|eukprot:CEL91861.1 unnamed protein product [Vitrella brassicaformis CCMP3155]
MGELPPASKVSGHELRLTKLEESLFELLLNVVKDKGLQTTLRVAGGWVRDKLVAVYHPQLLSETDTASPDIDLAIEGMSGVDFVQHVNDWLVVKGEAPHNVGVIARNPDKSKHLETATVKLMGVSVDFVNLRTDTYTEDSRIPTIEPGKPEEDARRRDFTINALFYNLNEKKVEDLTGRGIEDLQDRVLQTPLDPFQTLLEDPLRVLRAIRFASRFGLRISSKLEEACRDEQVHQALRNKVSRERIGAELDKMMGKGDPLYAWQLITSFRLASILFRLPELFYRCVKPSSPTGVVSEAGNAVVVDTHRVFSDGMRTVQNLHSIIEQFHNNGTRLMEQCEVDEKRLMEYAAFLAPLAGLQYKGEKGKSLPVIPYLIGDQLKLPKRDADRVDLIVSTACSFQRLVGEWGKRGIPRPPSMAADRSDHEGAAQPHADDATLVEGPGLSPSEQQYRVNLGLLLRRAGQLWKASLLVAMADAVRRVPASSSHATCDSPSPPVTTGAPSSDVPSVPLNSAQRDLVSAYKAVYESVEQFGLVGVWKQAPLLNGKAVKGLLPRLRKDSEFKAIMDKQMEWVLSHPSGTINECTGFIHQEWDNFSGLSERVSARE